MTRHFTKLLFIGILLFVTNITQAQQGRVDGGKRKAKQYEKAIKAIAEQTETIVKGAITDEEKVLNIYKWLKDNVQFDNNLWVHLENMRYKGVPGKKGMKTYWQYAKFTIPLKMGLYKLADLETAEKTFKRKKGVSMGISGLFEIMCALADINAVSVKGYAKGYRYEVGDRFYYANHTWNAVKTGNNWRLLDITWGSSIMEPELFIRKHAPLDPAWQLLDKPVSIEFFEKDTLEIDKYIGQGILPDSGAKYQNYKDSIALLFRLPHAQQELCIADRIGRYNKRNYWDQCVGNYRYAALMMRDSFPKIEDIKPRIAFEKYCLKHYEKALDMAKKSERISTKENNKRELEKIKLRRDKIIATIDETKKDIASDTKEKEQDSHQLVKESKSNATELLKELKLKHKLDIDSTKADNERFVAQLAAEGDKEASLIRNMNKEALVAQKKRDEVELQELKLATDAKIKYSEENEGGYIDWLKKTEKQQYKQLEDARDNTNEWEKREKELENRRFEADKSSHKKAIKLCENEVKKLKDFMKKEKKPKKQKK